MLFLHGLVMDNLSSLYFSVANAVAAHREAVLYDLRGHGLSERTATGYGLDALVSDAVALLDALSLPAVRVVGNSFGGLLALALAAARPDRVRACLLVDALLPEPGWGEAMAATLSLQGEERDSRIAESFRHWLGRHSERKRNRLARQARALVEETTLLSDLRASRALSDAELAAISCPVRALYGADSDQRERGERLARLLPACTLEIFPGCSHSILWEETARLRKVIVAWACEEG